VSQGAVKYALTDFLLLTSVLGLKFVKEVDGLLLSRPPFGWAQDKLQQASRVNFVTTSDTGPSVD